MNVSYKEQFDCLPGSLLITDKKSKVVYANAALQKRTGFAIAEIVGKKPGELWGGGMARSFYQTMWRTIGKGIPFTGMVDNTKKNGARYSETLFIAPLKDRNGVTQYFAEIHPDPRERKEEVFGTEFVQRARNFHREKNPLLWIVESLGGKYSGTQTVAERLNPEKDFPDLTSLFHELLIQPLQKVFSRRYEDALLIERAQRDSERFSELYEKYYLLIREYFLRRLSYDSETAEDLSQEVFSKAFRYLPSFRITNASYYTYLLRISHNVLVNYYRKQSGLAISQNETDLESIPASTQEISGIGIDALFSGLSGNEKSIMQMKYQDGLKIKEIAEKIGKTENAVKLILSRTRKKLQRENSE